MKKISASVFILFAFLFIACNSNTDKPAEDTPKGPDTPKTEAPVAKAPEAGMPVPFDMVEISHTVKDFDSWKKDFDLDSTARKASGLEMMVIGRSMDKPNDLMIALNAADIPKAKDFASNPRLKEVMEKNGVTGRPSVDYFHVLRFQGDPSITQWVLIKHKVKDYDAWLKVYDGEGPAKRAEYGLADAVLARGVDDPNMVEIVFDIKDLAKAKARMKDPELKKLMEGAGVVGMPSIAFYNSAQ